MKQPLQLRDDHVLVVAGVADQRAARPIALQIVGAEADRPAHGQGIAEEEGPPVIGVHVGLIAGSAAIDIVEVEGRGAVVGDRVGILDLLETRRGIEGQVVVDELAEVGVERRHTALLGVRPVLRLIETGGHRRGQLGQVRMLLGLVSAEPRGRRVREQSAKARLEVRVEGRLEAAVQMAVSVAHRALLGGIRTKNGYENTRYDREMSQDLAVD